MTAVDAPGWRVLKSTGIAVLEIERDPARSIQAVVDAGAAMVRQNSVDVLILGCGVFAAIADEVRDRLIAAGGACATHRSIAAFDSLHGVADSQRPIAQQVGVADRELTFRQLHHPLPQV